MMRKVTRPRIVAFVYRLTFSCYLLLFPVCLTPAYYVPGTGLTRGMRISLFRTNFRTHTQTHTQTHIHVFHVDWGHVYETYQLGTLLILDFMHCL